MVTQRPPSGGVQVITGHPSRARLTAPTRSWISTSEELSASIDRQSVSGAVPNAMLTPMITSFTATTPSSLQSPPHP
jgi:hypothetical protein